MRRQRVDHHDSGRRTIDAGALGSARPRHHRHVRTSQDPGRHLAGRPVARRWVRGKRPASHPRPTSDAAAADRGPSVIKVVVADDQVLLRAGLAGIVNTADDMTVVGDAADGNAAVETTRSTHPDIVLMDIRMPVMDGIEATRQIVDSTNAKVMILTTFDLDRYVYEALRNGASGFLVKDTPPADLLAAVRVVAAGDALLSPSVTRRLIDRFARGDDNQLTRPPVTLPDTVTSREREVLALVATGKTNHEIAEQLHIGIGTAKTHVARLLAKLGARDRVQ